jgi:putative membrane protein
MHGIGLGGWGMGGWIAMVVFLVLFWGGTVAAVILASRRTHQSSPLMPIHHDAERILHERFARGEIDETEYVARHTALRRLT